MINYKFLAIVRIFSCLNYIKYTLTPALHLSFIVEILSIPVRQVRTGIATNKRPAGQSGRSPFKQQFFSFLPR
jgi:hypothetical protein